MTTSDLAAQILEKPAALEALVAPLDDAAAAELVEHFKSEADRHWWINANRSLEFAELIIRIGKQRNDLCHTALGTMARGDALKLLGQLQEAWDELERAGEMFTEAGDEVGWARTRIGRLKMAVDLDCLEKALEDAFKAKSLLLHHNRLDKVVVLYSNMAVVYKLLGEYHQALELYNSALSIAVTLGETYEWIGQIYTNMGNVYDMLGEFRQSIYYHELARSVFENQSATAGVALADFNKAHIFLTRGNYNIALKLLYQSRSFYLDNGLTQDVNDLNIDIAECYLALNRHKEAHEICQEIASACQKTGETLSQGIALLYIAVSAHWRDKELTNTAILSAKEIFQSIAAMPWLALAYLHHSQILLDKGAASEADQEAALAQEIFSARGQEVNLAFATLLRGKAQLALGNIDSASKLAVSSLRVAKYRLVPNIQYGAHLVLAIISEQTYNLIRARRHYIAALVVVERLQRSLAFPLRSAFLEDKSEAVKRLIKFYLQLNNSAEAFEILERGKSQIVLSYLTNLENLRWHTDTSLTQALKNELLQLREEHHWFYQLAYEQIHHTDKPESAFSPEQARIEATAREKRIREITEQLYLYGGDGVAQFSRPKLHNIQMALCEGELLIEFYNDGSAIWAFTFDQHNLEVECLTVSVDEIDKLLTQLQSNIDFALVTQGGPMAHRLSGTAQRILGRLHDALLTPLMSHMRGQRRLIFVPYGSLHYLPFHLLHNGTGYLIEQYELVILPAAGFLARRGPSRPAGARVFIHSWESRLLNTEAEAKLVVDAFGGEVYNEEAARRDLLDAKPTQILHIVAHGEHRLDQPDLSFIELADGQLYADDLLQLDMSYELVVLSGCETGKAKVAAGDELIGLGRGFLYAGTGALVSSLWRVTDDTTVTLMQYFYAALRAGKSKAAALREAQVAILSEQPDLHPAFWGAFQLVGDASPLSGLGDGIQENADTNLLMTTELA